MRVELILNPRAEGYEQLQNDLRVELQELGSLGNVPYTEVRTAPPPDVLSGDYDVLRFIFEHGDALLLVTALIELVREVILRRNIAVNKDNPPTIVAVGNLTVNVPSSTNIEKRFMRELTSSPTKGASTKKSRRKRKRRKRPR